MQKLTKLFIPKLDLILAALGSITLGAILTRFGLGGPLSTDILLYMDAGLNHVEQTFILNRYFHVFVEGVFLRAAPSPLIGFQYYWAFLIAATAFLVYYNARFFTLKTNLIHGILATGIFLSVKYFATEAGVAGVDLAAMFMVTVIVTIYLASARRQHRVKWILILLGAFFFLAFKTKETTLISGILFIGLGFQGNKFDFKIFLKNIVYLLAGILAGIFCFAVLSWIMLGDPFFGLRPNEIYEFLTTYVSGAPGAPQGTTTSGNWYTTYLLQIIYIPFILYLISGTRPSGDVDPSYRFVWWLPLGLTIFVSLSANITWGPRFLMPAVPVICILAPQFLNFEIPNSTRERIRAAVLFSAGIILLLIVRLIMRYLLAKLGWNPSQFMDNIYEPAILSFIFAIAFFWKRLSLTLSIIVAVLIIAWLSSPLISNLRSIINDHSNHAATQQMFYPYSAFSQEIHYTSSMKMLVSLDAWQAVGMPDYNENVDNTMELFNIYFDAGSIRSNYIVDSDLPSTSRDILQANYNYALLSMGDWQSISSDPLIKSTLEQKFQIYFEPENLVVLLEAR